MACGVYKIQSIMCPDRCYIGSAVDFSERWSSHLSLLSRGNHRNKKLQGHYDKYGKDDLVFSIVAICDREELIPINGIVRPEQFFIWAYNPSFNICRIAGSRLGVVVSEETREKLRVSHIGKKQSAETIAKKSMLSKGRPAVWNKGRPAWNKGLTKETDERVRLLCEKSSQTKKGKPPWNKGKKGVMPLGRTPWNKGKSNVYSDETLNKMSESQKQIWGIRKQDKIA